MFEGIGLLSIKGFSFLILVLFPGYLYIEILQKDKYIWRETLDKHNDCLFDRILHYIFGGFIFNIVTLVFLIIVGQLEAILNILGSVSNIAKILSENFGIKQINIQLLGISASFFIFNILMVWIINELPKTIRELIEFIYKFIKIGFDKIKNTIKK